MPEIAEIARAVHFIRTQLVNKTVSKALAVDDANVFGKVGTSGAEFEKALTGRKIIGAGQQGKYFWLVMDKPPHPLIHFGMTGWLKIRGLDTYYYRKTASDGDDDEQEQWPPKFWKFQLQMQGKEQAEAAFVDSRRFGRVRLLQCEADDIRKISPLKENGPDPVIDKEVVTVTWLTELTRKKKIPIKALLLDQANISGIGNWVGDEIMYNAKMHPEQYSNTLSDKQIKQLHQSIHYICGTAVDLLAESERFPEEWLFLHRWGKGRKDAPKALPNGEKIAFLTVGGRTSAVVPSVQKKTGPVAQDMSEVENGEEDDDKKPKANAVKAGKKRKVVEQAVTDEPVHSEATHEHDAVKDKASGKRQRKSKFKEELSDNDHAAAAPVGKSTKNGVDPRNGTTSATHGATRSNKAGASREKKREPSSASASQGQRRSGRLSRG